MFHVCSERSSVYGASSSATLQPSCSQLRLPLSVLGPHVHAARLSKRTSGIAATRTGGPSPGSRSIGIEEEVVDAIAVLERPGAVPNTHFEQHDHGLQLLSQLQDLNSKMDTAVMEADTVLEQSEWDTLTLPPEVKEDFVRVYRDQRKEADRHKKEERRQRKALREQQRAARHAAQQQPQDPAPESPIWEQPLPAGQQQPSVLQPQQAPQQQPAVQSNPQVAPRPAASARQQPLRTPQQPLSQQLPQQPGLRTRRQRSSATALTAAATAASSSSSSQEAAPAPAARTTAAARDRQASAAAVSSAVPAAPAAPAAASTASRTRVARSSVKAAAAAATAPDTTSSSSSSSSESSSLALPSALVPVSSGNSFAPLPGLPVVRSGGASARRLQRAAGIGGRSSTATRAAAAAAPTLGAKLSDNTMHGLDMRAELLTGDQEKDLAVMVQDLLTLEATAKELAVQLGRTPSDFEWMEAAGAAGSTGDVQLALNSFQARLQAGRSAKQVMIKANYKLVVSICRKYQGHGMNMGDLINEGIAGLVKGVERFEPAKGFKFSTYAHWWIRQAVTRSLAEQGRLVRLPVHMQELLSKASKASKAFEAKHGREPTAEELAPELGVDASRIKDAWDAVINPRSLDQPVGSDVEGGTLGDVVEDDRTIGSEEAVYMESLKKDLEGVLAGLSARDAGVLRMRFGLLDGREYTLDEVGAEFKVTRERIRQIEAKVIRELRAHHIRPGSVMADYQSGPMSDKQLASRTSSGTKKQK